MDMDRAFSWRGRSTRRALLTVVLLLSLLLVSLLVHAGDSPRIIDQRSSGVRTVVIWTDARR